MYIIKSDSIGIGSIYHCIHGINVGMKSLRSIEYRYMWESQEDGEQACSTTVVIGLVFSCGCVIFQNLRVCEIRVYDRHHVSVPAGFK